MQGYTLSCQLIEGREECRGTLFLSSISNSRESNSVGVHSFLPVDKHTEKSAGVHSFLPVNSGQRRVQGYTLSLEY